MKNIFIIFCLLALFAPPIVNGEETEKQVSYTGYKVKITAASIIVFKPAENGIKRIQRSFPRDTYDYSIILDKKGQYGVMIRKYERRWIDIRNIIYYIDERQLKRLQNNDKGDERKKSFKGKIAGFLPGSPFLFALSLI